MIDREVEAMGWMRDRDVGTLVADTVPRALTGARSHTRCFRLSCDALSSRRLFSPFHK